MTKPTFLYSSENYSHIVRLLNTNVQGGARLLHALTDVKGIGKRMAKAIVEVSGIDYQKKCGELTPEEQDRIKVIAEKPAHFGIPVWFLNNLKDRETGKNEHLLANNLMQKQHVILDRLKKIKCVRGIRHYLGYKVRGQRMKSNGRRRPQQKLGILHKGKK